LKKKDEKHPDYESIETKNQQYHEIRELFSKTFVGHRLGTNFYDIEIECLIPEKKRKAPEVSDDEMTVLESPGKKRRIE